MKMTKDDYSKLQAIVNKTLDHNHETMGSIKDRYIVSGKTVTRFAWDVYNAISDRLQASKDVQNYLWLRGLYDRYNDIHILTAMLKIINTKGA